MADIHPAIEAQTQSLHCLTDRSWEKPPVVLDGAISSDKRFSEKDFGRISKRLMDEEILLNTWCSFHEETAGYREETDSYREETATGRKLSTTERKQSVTGRKQSATGRKQLQGGNSQLQGVNS